MASFAVRRTLAVIIRPVANRCADRYLMNLAAPKKWKESWRPKILLSLFSILLALGSSELVVRWFDLVPKLHRLNPGLQKTVYRFSKNPILGYVFKENYRDNQSPDLSTSYPYINAHGFRDKERTYEKPKGVTRIILLGDSVVTGAEYIEQFNNMISGKLEKTLDPSKVEVLNISVNGYCTRAEIELLKERGIKYAPDLVILVFVHNDYININADLGRADLRRPRVVEFLFVHSHLFRNLILRINLFDMKTRFGVNDYAGEWFGTTDFVNSINTQNTDRDDRRTFKEHVSNLGESNVTDGLAVLSELADRHDFNVVIGIWPTFLDDKIVDAETAPLGTGQFVSVDTELEIERLAAEHGFPTFRFSRYFTEDFNQRRQKGDDTDINPNLVYSGDYMHPNNTATTVAASAIKALLMDNPKWLQPGNSQHP